MTTDDQYPPLIPSPTDPAEWDSWLKALEDWRRQVRSSLDLSSYDRPEFDWMRRCYVCGKVMLFDREFYDEASNRFTVDRYLDRMDREFGGLDALVLWQAYPRIGIDDRNQYDHYRLAPELKRAVEALHARGVRAFMAYNPWDVGTRREPNSDSETIGHLVREFGFDGVFLDTLQEGSKALRGALDSARPGVAMESELALPVEGIPTHHASWAQWLDDSEVPGILRNRWVEPRHMMHLVRRWDLDHSGELQLSWMDGAGIFVWENVFGSWNGWSDRDKAILRTMTPIRRRYADLFSLGTRLPVVSTMVAGVHAALYTHRGLKLWTLVNRGGQPAEGPILPVSSDGSERLFDLVRGEELDHGHLKLPPRWIGAVLAVPASQVNEDLTQFLRARAEEFNRSVAARTIRVELRTVRAIPSTALVKTLPRGMHEVVKGERTMKSRFRARECGEYEGAPFPNFVYPQLHFERIFEERIRFGRFAVDEREVTNGQFLEFILATSYRPEAKDSFLAHWVGGRPKGEDVDRAVTFVGLEDARAYCRWAQKRLPTEYEWQLAVSEGQLTHGAVWNLTESEHFDGHTRFSILKGGASPKIDASPWYTDSGAQPPAWSTKLIHFYPAIDRSPSIGFRAAVDLV